MAAYFYNSITGIDKAEKDLTEDIQGIVFGDSNYTKKEYGTTEYIASPSQDAALSTGKAKLNSKEKTITYINKNQFTESEKIIADTVKKYGADNITFVGHSLGGGLAQYYAVKHDSNAITFAAADVYSLLSEEEQQEVAKGKFKDNIISYTYPDDFVGTFYNDSIGSVYYMSEPKDSSKGISTHKIKNYMVEDLYDKEGYFLPSTLYDEKIHRQLASSPLKMKNKGVENFYIRIQGSLMAAYVKELEGSSELIEATRKALVNFLDYYVESMTELKNTYLAKVGTGQYDKLSTAHVNEYFADYTNIDEEGVPMLLDIEEFEGLMSMIGKALSDTDEIAYHMEKMSNDFNEADTQLAQWLQLKK
ncbi:alpha/beta fold hydrolase [Virgibacillus halodenitrificans]|uniref:alpha/beta fold hydrolase n=1 Tax=Virgibacillus halodenitrificans TaxID=1482 RepID=UPI001F42857C|nr:alpha/beta fold hydrolase [Virgibacillus halodenitrificans]